MLKIFVHYILAFKTSLSIAFKLRAFSSLFSSWSSRCPSKRTIQLPAWKIQYLLRSSDHSGSSWRMRYTTKLRGDSTRSYWTTCRDRRLKWSNLVHCGRLANYLRQREKKITKMITQKQTWFDRTISLTMFNCQI